MRAVSTVNNPIDGRTGNGGHFSEAVATAAENRMKGTADQTLWSWVLWNRYSLWKSEHLSPEGIEYTSLFVDAQYGFYACC